MGQICGKLNKAWKTHGRHLRDINKGLKTVENCKSCSKLQYYSELRDVASILFSFCWQEKRGLTRGREFTLPTLIVRSHCCMVKTDLITPHDQSSWGAAEEEVLAKSCKIIKT